jgi:predicted nuclease with TOPRIM domain
MIIEIMIPALSAAFGSFVTWFFGRKKSRLENDKIELDLIAMWKGIADDLRAELATVSSRLHEVTNELERLRQENAKLKEEVHHFMKSKVN